jgi:hypothetical protein
MARIGKKEDLTVACCLWGDWPSGDKVLGVEYVNKLYRAVQRNLTLPHRFVCFTDSSKAHLLSDGIIRQPMDIPTRRGETPKWIFYKPNNGLTGRVLGMDLDTVILGNIDRWAEREEEFIIRKTFNPQRMKTCRAIGGDMVSFYAGTLTCLWDVIVKDPRKFEAIGKGDERIAYDQFLPSETEIAYWQDLFPDEYISFKRHHRKIYDRQERKDYLEKAKVISFHGKPRPHEVNKPFVKKNWV